MTKERIEKLLKAGANVVLTTKGIDDMALKASFFCICFIRLLTGSLIFHILKKKISSFLFQYFVEAGAIAVRRVRKEDMRHVAKATGATMVLSYSV